MFLLSLQRQPSYSLDPGQTHRTAGPTKATGARSICRGAGLAATRAAYVRLDWTRRFGLAPPSCCVVVGVTVAATNIHGRASPLYSVQPLLSLLVITREFLRDNFVCVQSLDGSFACYILDAQEACPLAPNPANNSSCTRRGGSDRADSFV